jgi:endonuclease/exonuclease/phosphatase (EEP) superfamily protein YafD
MSRPNRGKAVARLFFVLALSGLLAGGLARVWPSFDIASQLALHFTFLAVAAAVAILVGRGVVLSVLMFGLFTVVHGLLPGALALFAEGRQRQPGEIRVGTFSTLGTNVDLAAIEHEILRLDPDVMTLLEVWPAKRPLLSSLRSRFPYIVSCEDVLNCHLAIISKHPFVSASYRGNWAGAPQIAASFGDALGGLTIIGVHLSRFPDQALQQKQAGVLAEQIRSTGGRLVLTGDFNATPFSVVQSQIMGETRLVRRTYFPTWPAQFGLPQFALDHIFVGPGIDPVGWPLTGQYAGSDHLPVVMDVVITEP